MGQNKWRYSKKIHIWNRVRLSLRGKKIIVNQTLLSKLWYIGQICTIPKYTKKQYTIFSGTGINTTSQTPDSTLNLDDWTRYFRHRDTIKLSENKMDSKFIEFYQCSLEKSHVYRWNLILNYNQGLSLFRQNKILRSTSHKYLQKQNNEDFFIQLLNTCLHFANNNFLAWMSVKKLFTNPYF